MSADIERERALLVELGEGVVLSPVRDRPTTVPDAAAIGAAFDMVAARLSDLTIGQQDIAIRKRKTEEDLLHLNNELLVSVPQRVSGLTVAVAVTARMAAWAFSQPEISVQAWHYSVTNLHDFPIRITLLDLIPLSADEKVVINILPEGMSPTTHDVDGKRGVPAWTLSVPAAQKKEIDFGYRITWPKDVQLGINE